MKVAIFSPFFWPEPISTGKYNTILAEALTDAGAEVDVFCSHSIYPKWKPEKVVQNHPKITTIRGGLWMKYVNSQVVKRLSLELWYMSFIFKNIFTNKKRYDMTISIYPPVFFGFLTNLFLNNKNNKNVVISHDIQGILALKENRTFRKLVSKIIWKIEKRVYKNADHIVFLSQSMKKFCVENYGVDDSKTSIYYPFQDLSSLPQTNDLTCFNGNERCIVYSGALGEKQAPDKIIKLFDAIVEKDSSFKCFIFSCGPVFEKLKEKNSNNNIIFNDLVPLKNLRELLEKSLFQLIPQDIGTADAVLPSKLPNILVAGSNVVCITEKGNEIELLLQKVSNALVFFDWDYEKIANSILTFYGDSQNFCKSRKVREDIKNLFDVELLVGRLIKDLQ